MSSFREGSPDWLHSYKAPTTSLLSLFSLSKSSPDDSPYRESETVSSLLLPDDSDATTVVDEESAESRKNSATKVVTKQASIELVFSRKKKAGVSVNLKGKQNGEKLYAEKFSRTHKEAQIEAIMNDFIQLTPQSNVYEANKW